MLAIALANKLARIAWAVLARDRSYQPRIVADAARYRLTQVHQWDDRTADYSAGAGSNASCRRAESWPDHT